MNKPLIRDWVGSQETEKKSWLNLWWLASLPRGFFRLFSLTRKKIIEIDINFDWANYVIKVAGTRDKKDINFIVQATAGLVEHNIGKIGRTNVCNIKLPDWTPCVSRLTILKSHEWTDDQMQVMFKEIVKHQLIQIVHLTKSLQSFNEFMQMISSGDIQNNPKIEQIYRDNNAQKINEIGSMIMNMRNHLMWVKDDKFIQEIENDLQKQICIISKKMTFEEHSNAQVVH